MVDIIIPIYNTEREYLSACIDSIFTQNFQDFRCLLIDDGSKNETADYLDELQTRDPRITVYHKENGGVSSARNYGLSRSIGDYVMFVDADDYLTEKSLAYMVECARLCQADIVSFNSYSVYEDERKELSNQNKDFYEINEWEIDVFRREFLGSIIMRGTKHKDILSYDTVWGKLFKREVLENILFPIELWAGEDKAFMFKLLGNIKKIAYFPKAVYCYRQNELSTVHVFNKATGVNTDNFLRIIYEANQEVRDNQLYMKAYCTKVLEAVGFYFKYFLCRKNYGIYRWRMRDFCELMKKFPYSEFTKEFEFRDMLALPKRYLLILFFCKLHLYRCLYMIKKFLSICRRQ